MVTLETQDTESSDRCGPSPEQSFISPLSEKGQECMGVRRQGEPLQVPQSLPSSTNNNCSYLPGARQDPLYHNHSRKREGLSEPPFGLRIYWLVVDSGKGRITAFSCVPSVDPTGPQHTAPKRWLQERPWLVSQGVSKQSEQTRML